MTGYSPLQPGLPRVLAKLKARQPITVVTMGDSLTDKRHWANQQKLWAEMLVKQVKESYGSEVRLVNPAIGGTTLSQNLILAPRWLQDAPSPDLVVIWFGGNDWDDGVRGLRYKQYLGATIDRLRRLTRGRAEILVMTTCPGFNRWETLNELCQAAYQVAQEKKTGFADVATAFHKAGSREEALKRQYWAWDNVHLGAGGHALVVDTVMRALQSEGLADFKTAGSALWMKTAIQQLAEGETPLGSFEPGQETLVVNSGGEVVQEHATDGKHALLLKSKEKDYVTLSLEDGRSLRPLHDNARFLADVFNPQPKAVSLGILVRDAQSKDYNSRYNGSLTIKPGSSTIDIDYTRLPRTSNERSAQPDYLDLKQITLFVLVLEPHGNGSPVTLYFDNVRLAGKKAGAKQ